ncbi:hypothetical protein Tco_0677716 [Tanacetum coccineum]|uniref:Uncharacterized protein n=1 Tax=Tanacetum coccineum TaxID=301880 RepID=A0ABQ4XCZ3_9ASTR
MAVIDSKDIEGWDSSKNALTQQTHCGFCLTKETYPGRPRMKKLDSFPDQFASNILVCLQCDVFDSSRLIVDLDSFEHIGTDCKGEELQMLKKSYIKLDMKAMKDNIKAGLIPFKTDQEILDEIKDYDTEDYDEAQDDV